MVTPVSDAAAEFGARVREQRQRIGISQETLAELSGIHWTALGKIERGQRNPSLRNIVKIASGLDVDAGILVTGLTADMLPQDDGDSRADLIRLERERDRRGDSPVRS
ncbi:XRE family transcriptional regulator [Clavibacter michiganensis]|uniref:Anaerobic benzoate catabolism transcriptional regulator n=1 Tax=Clavibacter michiganensis TaxID=28447 RepID=A0A251XTK5_9MICO|nr:helix-turn-helix transcriptional regulator [Clavibacter michiganensis]OUE08619.1 anaerobic benzoate catabolism transcriptional regulator [Clavibacter michiganensis]PPF53524.1 XRE family transcriptional regulator [Clavibacter michiganensis]PPF62790.1 XRE family transcriptional regulator [Clavibacter michiganensis]